MYIFSHLTTQSIAILIHGTQSPFVFVYSLVLYETLSELLMTTKYCSR
nr:MAG TPA: hypothetical protein [Bacteriophage sp.]